MIRHRALHWYRLEAYRYTPVVQNPALPVLMMALSGPAVIQRLCKSRLVLPRPDRQHTANRHWPPQYHRLR